MPAYIKTPQADSDLQEIYRYTKERWGLPQAKKYLHSLTESFEFLADNPQTGRPRDDIRKGYRSLHKSKHHIFYRVEGQNILIVRILHHSRDIERQING